MVLEKARFPRSLFFLWMALLMANAVPLYAVRQPVTLPPMATIADLADRPAQTCACNACVHDSSCCCKSARDPLTSTVLRAACDRGEKNARHTQAKVLITPPPTDSPIVVPAGDGPALPAYRVSLLGYVSAPLAPPPRFL